MPHRLISRLIQSLLVLLVMSFVVYGLIGLMPGDPIDLMISANPDVTSEDAARLKALYGLDQPLLSRYGNWLGAAFSGDLGYSRLYGAPVVETLLPALGNSLILLLTSLFVALALALPIGILAALKPRSGFDYFANLIAFAGISMPTFWLGIMLMTLFSVVLGWLPASGMETVGDGGFVDRITHLILPVMTLAAATVGQHTRYIRASMIETLREPYIRTARAKGLSTARVVMGHALRNALIPVVTILALDFGALFSGALITETVFAYPGMGKLIFDAIMGNDYNLAMAALLLATGVTLIGNTLADGAYGALDPRISQ